MTSQRPRTASGASRTGFPTILLLSILFLSSCSVKMPPGYFHTGFDTSAVQRYKNPELTIQKGDHLNIMFYSDNPSATAIYNQTYTGESASGTGRIEVGSSLSRSTSTSDGGSIDYIVDSDGNIRIHAIGTIRAESHTRASLERLLTEKIKAMGTLSNPYCLVRFSGFRITVLGEVTAPGVYTINGERATILDALGIAGDIAFTGRKSDVMRIREANGDRTFSKIDLTSPDLMKGPDYYVQQNDIIIVQQNGQRQTTREMQRIQYVGMAVNVLSVLTLLLNLF